MQTFSPGIYDGVPLAAYQNAAGVGHSDLLLFSRSPAHYEASRAQPVQASQFETLLRLALLRPVEFRDGISHALAQNRKRDSERKSQASEDACAGLPIISEAEVTGILGACDAVRAHPAARSLLDVRGENDVSIFGCHPATGLTLRARLDRLVEDGDGRPWIVEIKACTDVLQFARSAREMRADVQSAFSTDVLALAGLPEAVFVFIAVGRRPTANGKNGKNGTHKTHGVRVITLDAPTLENARAIYESELARFAECETSGVWSAHSEEIECIGV